MIYKKEAFIRRVVPICFSQSSEGVSFDALYQMILPDNYYQRKVVSVFLERLSLFSIIFN